jgi:hypothetical protein
MWEEGTRKESRFCITEGQVLGSLYNGIRQLLQEERKL